MGRRHEGHTFMPGKYVFPGGRVEPEDRRMCVAGALDTHVEEKLNARVPRPSPGFARAIALAAIRETFEETGLALGVSDYGAPDNPPPGAWTRFAATGVYPALDDIDFLARAITPPGRPQALRRALSRHRRARHRQARRGRGPSGSGARRTRLDAARQGARPGPARHNPSGARRSREALEGGLDTRRPRPFYRELRGRRLREEL